MLQDETADERQIMVDVSHVSMSFNMANEQLNSLKEYFIKFFRHELFFKEFVALDDISFSVREGDVYGIVGTNGSGKSTMLKIVAGVLEPTKGTCAIHGRIAPLIELGAGFDLELTARENIFLNGSLLGYSRKYIEKHFDEIVEFAELRDFLDLPMKNYSSGMVARIAFAIATIIVPDILIVDEALSVGDVFFQEKCERRIKSLIKDHGTTVLFVSHSIEQVERICQRAIWIEKGHKVMEGDVHEVCAAYRSMGYIDFANTNGIMDRAHDGSFDIRDEATCDEMREMLTRLGGEAALDKTFAVAASASAGIAAENSPSPVAAVAQPADFAAETALVASFNNAKAPALLSRETAALLLYRFAYTRRGLIQPDKRKELSLFADGADIDVGAREAVVWCVSHGLLQGTVSDEGERLFDPSGAITRIGLAKMVTVLFRQVLSYPDDVSPTASIARSGDYDYVTGHGIMAGYPSGLFGPRDSVKRAQVAIVLWRCAGCPDPGEAYDFSDAEEGDWWIDQASWAVAEGIMKPLAKGMFGPEDPMDPAEFQEAVHSFCEKRNLKTPDCAPAATSTATLPDAIEEQQAEEAEKRKSRPTVGRSTQESVPQADDERTTRAQLLVVAARLAREAEAIG